MGEWQCGWSRPDPRWSPWNLTAWGGAMTDGDMGESLLFSHGFRSEIVAGVGAQATLWKQRRLGLIVDANLFHHRAMRRHSSPRQAFSEGTLGLGLRYYPNHWLSATVVEGVSAYSEHSELALRRGGNGRRLVNYLAFELDAAINPQVSLVARLHHRSGIYGTINCGKACDTNGYLLGFRYHPGRPALVQSSQAEPQASSSDASESNSRESDSRESNPSVNSPPERSHVPQDPPAQARPDSELSPENRVFEKRASGIGIEAGGLRRRLLVAETPLLHAPAEQQHQGAQGNQGDELAEVQPGGPSAE